MKIEIETSESHEPTRHRPPPPDYSSRGMRAKLLVLVGSLMLVLIMMNEARKPENWKWMGFGEDGKLLEKNEGETKKLIVQEHQYDSTPSTDKKSSDENLLDELKGAEKGAEKSSVSRTKGLADVDTLSEGIREREFWKLLFRQFELRERRELFDVLREIRQGNEASIDMAVRESLVEKIDQRVQVRCAQLLGRLSLIVEGDPLRERISNQLQSFQDQWGDQLKPVLLGLADDELSTVQTKGIADLQDALDEAAFAEVLDNSSPTRSADGPAWTRAWESVLGQSDFSNWPTEVTTPIQLKAQPKIYRRKPVSMSGELRGIELIPAAKTDPLGIETYYSAWIRPTKISLQPFNVFFVNVPDGLQLDEGKKFTPFEKTNVWVQGEFFKIRSYKDAGGSVSETPLIFAQSLTVMETAVEAAPIDVRGDWELPRSYFIAFLIGMPLIAGGLAFWAYRGTISQRYQPGPTVSKRIDQSLHELSQDPSVQTVQERLSGLSREEN